MSEQPMEIVELKHMRPVKWSTVEKKLGPYKIGYVNVFLKYEGYPLLEEDGTPMVNARGTAREITATSFARHFGIAKTTFLDWVFDVRGYSPHPNSRVQRPSGPDIGADSQAGVESSRDNVIRLEQHGRCSHCPEWTEE